MIGKTARMERHIDLNRGKITQTEYDQEVEAAIAVVLQRFSEVLAEFDSPEALIEAYNDGKITYKDYVDSLRTMARQRFELLLIR